MNTEILLENVILKIKQMQELTPDEELIYLMEVRNMTVVEASAYISSKTAEEL